MARSGMQRKRAERAQSSNKLISFALTLTVWVAVIIFVVLPARERLKAATTELNVYKKSATPAKNYKPSSSEINSINQMLPSTIDNQAIAALGQKIVAGLDGFKFVSAAPDGPPRTQGNVTIQDAVVTALGPKEQLATSLALLTSAIQDDKSTGLLRNSNGLSLFTLQGVNFVEKTPQAQYQFQVELYSFK